jgi:hypothetical protein
LFRIEAGLFLGQKERKGVGKESLFQKLSTALYGRQKEDYPQDVGVTGKSVSLN